MLFRSTGAVILATRECIAAAGAGVRVEDKGRFEVKGRTEPVQLFSVLGIDDSSSAANASPPLAALVTAGGEK